MKVSSFFFSENKVDRFNLKYLDLILLEHMAISPGLYCIVSSLSCLDHFLHCGIHVWGPGMANNVIQVWGPCVANKVSYVWGPGMANKVSYVWGPGMPTRSVMSEVQAWPTRSVMSEVQAWPTRSVMSEIQIWPRRSVIHVRSRHGQQGQLYIWGPGMANKSVIQCRCINR